MSKPILVGPAWCAVIAIETGLDNGLVVQLASLELEIEVSFSVREVALYFPAGIDLNSRVKIWGCLEGERFVLGNVEQVRLIQAKQRRPATAN